ncbi:MAG: dephospho-CoA kinase [Deltaproteobacteria bacterium]|nr:dephospho-CoA kinase [Deltaproteobacteria bacterium]
MTSLAEDLMRPEAYPRPFPGAVELRETHVSWVFLTEGDVYKVKKPVRFAFLDFSTVEARRRACEAEVLLNERLAAGTYLGVVPVRRGADGRCHVGPEGEVVDWAVHMIRLPDVFRADERVRAGTLTGAHVDAIASAIASFHARVGAGPEVARAGSITALEANIEENFAEVDPIADDLSSREQLEAIQQWQLDFLRTRARVFERRRAEGRIRDGHGDLRLDHVYVGDDGELTIVDCIEFDPRFRHGDVCADIAFLSMDLANAGRFDLAERFLARYARAADDYELYALVDFYESYRAFVRGKISAIAARHAVGPARAEAILSARRHFALALAVSRRSMLTPLVVAVGGVIASGKSTVADALAARMAAPIVDADRTRKYLLGLGHTTHDVSGAFEGPYSQAMTDRVYAEVMLRASTVLESGRPVVIDASFRTEDMRRAARDLAHEHGVPFLMIECRVPSDVCRARLRERERVVSVSDGRLEILDAFVARMEPMNELPESERLVVDTTRPVEESVREIERRLELWPEGLVA